MNKKGFTLIEMLVVIAVVSVMGILITTIFSRSLRGGNKAQIILVLKQNGQSILETLDKAVRNSDGVICPVVSAVDSSGSQPSDTLVYVKDGVYIRYRFEAQRNAGADPNDCEPNRNLSSNGCIAYDNPTPQAGEDDPKIFRDRICQSTNPLSSATVINDTNNQTGVSVLAPLAPLENVFTREKKSGFKDKITIGFRLSPGISAQPVVAGQIDPQLFQTTIELR